MAVTITTDELAAFCPGLSPDSGAGKVLIDGVLAAATRLAPCLKTCDPDSPQAAEAKLIILSALKRLVSAADNAAVTRESVGPFSVEYAASVGYLSDNEGRKLAAICGKTGKAFALDTTPGSLRAPWVCPDFGRVPGIDDYPPDRDGVSRVDERPAGCGGHLPWCSTGADDGCDCGWAEP